MRRGVRCVQGHGGLQSDHRRHNRSVQSNDIDTPMFTFYIQMLCLKCQMEYANWCIFFLFSFNISGRVSPDNHLAHRDCLSFYLLCLCLCLQSAEGTVFFFAVGEEYQPIGLIQVPGPVQGLEWSPYTDVRQLTVFTPKMT